MIMVRKPSALSVDLGTYDARSFRRGRGRIIEWLWYIVGELFVSSVVPGSMHRRLALRLFGAAIGARVVIKPRVRVKFPWRLTIGDDSWVGEGVWIDNLAMVSIGASVCISQGAYLCTGSHDWSDTAFGLRVEPISVEDGSWVGARAVICPGVRIEQCGVATAGSVVSKSIPSFEVHAGNPAIFRRMRIFRDE
jgi:putative colanic acid biosynthesis acetyltransferase WcaF